MECPYCGAELEFEDSYGNKDYIIHGDKSGKSGDIYKCPNSEGFKTVEEVLEYIDGNEDDLEEYLRFDGLDSWEYIRCDSGFFSVTGSFYTDKQGELHEGYPC